MEAQQKINFCQTNTIIKQTFSCQTLSTALDSCIDFGTNLPALI